MVTSEDIKRRKGRPSKAEWLYFAETREAAGLTQQELAALCKLRQSQIGKWERGKFAPPFRYIQALATALNVPVAELAEQATLFFGNK